MRAGTGWLGGAGFAGCCWVPAADAGMTGEEGERRERGRGIGGGSGRRTYAGTDAESAVWFDTGLRKTPARLTTKGRG